VGEAERSVGRPRDRVVLVVDPAMVKSAEWDRVGRYSVEGPFLAEPFIGAGWVATNPSVEFLKVDVRRAIGNLPSLEVSPEKVDKLPNDNPRICAVTDTRDHGVVHLGQIAIEKLLTATRTT
jgi:hypothetical protein